MKNQPFQIISFDTLASPLQIPFVFFKTANLDILFTVDFICISVKALEKFGKI